MNLHLLLQKKMTLVLAIFLISIRKYIENQAIKYKQNCTIFLLYTLSANNFQKRKKIVWK